MQLFITIKKNYPDMTSILEPNLNFCIFWVIRFPSQKNLTFSSIARKQILIWFLFLIYESANCSVVLRCADQFECDHCRFHDKSVLQNLTIVTNATWTPGPRNAKETMSLTKKFFAVKYQSLSSVLPAQARRGRPRGTLFTRTSGFSECQRRHYAQWRTARQHKPNHATL